MSELTGLPETKTSQSGLQKNSLNWKHVTVLSLAGCGPAASIALNLQFMGQFAGISLVLAFLLVWPAILLLMNSLAQFSRHIHTAGGLYSYNLRTWGAKFGFVYGWVFLGAYMVLSAAGFAVFGGWLSEWLGSQFQVIIPWWLITLAAVAVVTALSIRGVTESMRTSLILVGFSVLVILVLALWILFTGGDSVSPGLSIEPLLPSGAGAAGWSGIGLAMSYAVLSHAGIEEGTTLAEEVKDPRRNVSKGLWLVALILPAFYILISYAMVHGYGIANIDAFGQDPAPLQTIAMHYWGEVGLGVVVIAAIVSILGFSQAGFLAGTRVLYTLGRDHVLPQWIGRSSIRKTPANASMVMGAITILLGVPLALVTGPFQVWGYFGFLIGIAFLISYIVTNVALIVYTRRIGVFSWWKHGVPAGAAALIFAYPLYRTVWPLPPGEYAVLPLVYIGWVVLGILLMAYTRAKRPEVLVRMMSEESKF
ncbi:APC family permease [Arthrobacter crystallopoietes]|uniref:APC family permease n=1 Tax=Crystallibacter crystallopoietes TaxID=37928 RepID=UPI0011112B8A|nr:APC family permease [Arthrobacter crystallopoietes]